MLNGARISGRSTLAVGLLAGLAGLAIDCNGSIDGQPLDPAALGEKICKGDLDCGPGRHCGSASTCEVDCNTSDDCSYALADPNAPNDLSCSPCGRCVAEGVRDSKCLSSVDQPCKDSGDCTLALGAGHACNPEGLCAQVCATDDDCKGSGRGFGCGAGGLCVRKCFRDQDCVFFGYQYACALPAGVDPGMNAEAFAPTFGECLPTAGLGFKPATPADPPSAAYQGVWGVLLAVSVRVDGVPILTTLNSVAIQGLLVKITWSGSDLVMDEKWCSVDLEDFIDSDKPPLNIFTVDVPDHNVDSILMTQNHVKNAPALVPGSAFVTDEVIDLRGAHLKNPATDPLPTHKDLTNQWDQDRDTFPGLTANVTGTLQGQIYQAQRTGILFNAIVVDADHLHGLITAKSDATTLGATDPELVNDAITSQHQDASRTYFRAQRLADEGSCADVINLQATAGSWLAFQPHFDPSARP